MLKQNGPLIKKIDRNFIETKNNNFKIKGEEDFFLEFSNKYYKISTSHGGVNPIFIRNYKGNLYLSNFEYLLIFENDKISIYGELLISNLTGELNQNYTFFQDIIKLKCSTLYNLTHNKILNERSKFFCTKSKIVEIETLIKSEYKKFKEKIILPLSGGIDSRLSLSLLKERKIKAIHEIKNLEEKKVVDSLSLKLGLKVDYVERSFKDDIEISKTNLEIISTTRPTFIKWYEHLSSYPKNFDIVGFSAEVHKGKFYNKILNLEEDCLKLFNTSNIRKKILKNELGFKDIYDKRRETILDFIDQAKLIYDNPYSQIDFLNYHLQVSNNRGKRSNAFSNLMNVKYPFFKFKIINSVFSLDHRLKQSGYISKELIKKNLPIDEDYISGNAKSFSKENIFFDKLFAVKYLLFPNRKDNYFKIKIYDHTPVNRLTNDILKLIISENKYININSSIIVYNYLLNLEINKKVSFEII